MFNMNRFNHLTLFPVLKHSNNLMLSGMIKRNTTTLSYSITLISREEKRTKPHFFNSGGGIRNNYEQHWNSNTRQGFDGMERTFSSVPVMNKKTGYLDRKEKKHLSRNANASFSSHSDRRRNSSYREEYDPFKPKVRPQSDTAIPLKPVRNKYITDDMDKEFTDKSNEQKIQAPSFFANPKGTEQAVKATKENVQKYIEEYKKSRGHHHHSHRSHHKEEHAQKKAPSFKHGHQDVREEVTPVDKNIRAMSNLDAKLSSFLNEATVMEIDENVDMESLVATDRLKHIEELLEQTENADFDKITAPKLSDEENRSRLGHLYFATIAEYIEECLLEKLKHQDKMTDEEYYRYLSLERPYITSVNISPDYRTVTLNYKLLIREEIDEMNEQAYERDRQILEKVFHEEFAAQALNKFIHYQRDVLNDFEISQHMKLSYKGTMMYVPTIFDEKPLPAEPGKRRQHINPYADMPHFTQQPFSGEKLFAKLEELGIAVPEDGPVNFKMPHKSSKKKK
ncbi:hypothetical protein C9374_013521 [Naegleria lovaniensis]|uniref:Uncharacterized protein n=1 Tax=Naegleria lovaniensis TaxID=51637 RepID=A0AA88H2V2_NAELO|nr:uncharacterized protein C9374_013521 [Naegleria lovaniensis]KAG2392036.1 hypothetical protein C9374_013521 [Naegleria lovaniensis]